MAHADEVTTHPVVISGGGPIGIGTALELARHGVGSVVLETRNRGEYNHARTNLTNLRSMEHFRRWGIADGLRANDPVGEDVARSVTYVTALNGHVVADFAHILAFDYQIPFSSERPEWAPNVAIEKTMQDAAADNPLIDIRFACTVTAFEECGDGVAVTYTDAAERSAALSARYLVAADGSRSVIRKTLGIRMQGVPDVAQCSIWHLLAPQLKDRIRVGRSSMVIFINDFGENAMLIAQGEDRYMFGFVPRTGDDPDDWGDARRALHRNAGFEFDAAPMSGGAVTIHSLLAPEFVRGRICLAGDAAHLISPMGGFGMNLGVGDAADLGWKLAATLQGWGGPALLDSYQTERRPVISWIQDLCLTNTERSAESFAREGMCADSPNGAAVRSAIGQEIVAVKSAEFQSFGAQLGARYLGSPIVVPDGTAPPALTQGLYEPSATPGCRAPHLWLDDESSLYDHFGVGFTLLVTGGHPIDTSAMETAAKERAMPLDVVALAYPEVRDAYGAELVLIRPDQHVAWRADTMPADAGSVLDTVRGGAHGASEQRP